MKEQLLLFIMMLLPMVASADAVEINGIYYNLITKAKQAEVAQNPNKYTGSVEIPESVTYDGVEYSVTTIGENAFNKCSGLTSVTIPNSVTSIGDHAFYNCSGLTSVTIGNSVTTIGEGAFSGCSGLTSVTIPNSVTSIGGSAFGGCSGLTSVTIPNSVTSIGNYAFYGCSGLTSVTIPNSVTSIEEGTFQQCSGLTSVTIPNSVTSIGEYAFRECSGLTSVTIPNSVTSLGEGAFYGCSGLTSVTIPNSVTSIGKYAFLNCSGLTSVTIPNSVTSIGNYAFSRCSGLTSVTIGNSVTSIEEGTFQQCSGLTSVTIPNSVTSIGQNAFYYCSGLTSVTIPNSVTSIGNSAFYSCSGLTSVTIGSSVKNIYDLAFTNCEKLETVYCLAENVPTTRINAFQDSYIEYATLFVPAASLNAYKTTAPWCDFGTFKTLEGTEIETQKCATPTISYNDKKLTFSCETEGVEYVSEIKDTDIKKYYDSEVQLSGTYEISVYATKQGWENSDLVTATLVWGSASFTETTDIKSVRALTNDSPVLIQSRNGQLTVEGAEDGAQVRVYGMNGVEVGSGISRNGLATVSTNLKPGSVAIIKMGDKSVKVVVR